MKRIILCLFLIVMAGLFVACGGGSTESADTGNGQAEQTQQESANAEVGSEQPISTESDGINWDEHVTFTWWMISTPPNDYYTSYNDNPVVNYLENRFNVTFDFEQAVVGTEADQLALMMGAGRYTDVIHLSPYSGSITQLYDDGVIIDIADWLDYMPNLRNLIETRPDIARAAFDDNGQILTLPEFNDGIVHPWSGLLYRHDILEAMTDGNIQFPSGSERPTTLADWEYMLPLFLAYFEAAGFADFAPLIIPPQGVIHFGELMSTFGAYHHFYVRDNVVHAGILEPAMFEYVSTMRDWFERGWIHQDFASRTTDMFFMPNPPLVFGGAAGVFYGMSMHLGDRLSMPDFDMYVDVRPISSPMAEGITHRDMLRRKEDVYAATRGSAVTTGNPDIGRFLAVMDHMYHPVEGGRLRTLGLTAEQIPPNDTTMARMGLSEGSYWFDAGGNLVFHPNIDVAGGHIINTAVGAIRLPGAQAVVYINAVRTDEMIEAHSIWGAHDEVTEVHPLPTVLTPTVEESAILSANDSRINDHRDQMLTMFIMGTAPLTEATWEEFTNQLIAFGIEENREIWQAAYNRYLVRGR
jgi:ABC-type glycerol-3-phosphate transport system substrate-binding protein